MSEFKKVTDEWLRVHRDEDGSLWYRQCPEMDHRMFLKCSLYPHPDDIRTEEEHASKGE